MLAGEPESGCTCGASEGQESKGEEVGWGLRGERRAGARARATHVDAPLLGVEVVGRERARNAQLLDLVNVLVAAIVARVGQALGVLVGQH
jgi:hypothetical protein